MSNGTTTAQGPEGDDQRDQDRPIMLAVPTHEQSDKTSVYEQQAVDRIALIYEANRFVQIMADQEIPTEKSGQELETYNAALNLLRVEFEAGPDYKVRMVKKADEEKTISTPVEGEITLEKGGPSDDS